MHCFILAGGFATRLWPLTEKRAKPLLPLAGKPIIDHLIENIPDDLKITVSTNSAFQKEFETWKKSQRKNIDLRIEYAARDDQKIGALGAVAQWIEEENINDDIFLLTGDNFFGISLKIFLDQFYEYKGSYILYAAYDLKDKEKAKNFGVLIQGPNMKLYPLIKKTISTKNIHEIIGLEEKPLNPPSSFISTGCYIFPKHTLRTFVNYAQKHPDKLGNIIYYCYENKEPIMPVIFDAMWFDIGSFDTYLEATKALVGDKCQYDKNISDIDKRTLDLRNGSVVVGAHSHVSDSTLTDSVIFEHCVIRNCVLERCIIDNHCILENIDLTGQMLREGTVLRRK